MNTETDPNVPPYADSDDPTTPSTLTGTPLPLLPVTTGVVFPDMVVTIRAESDDAQRSVAAASHTGDLLVIVPRNGTRYSSVGTVSRIEQSARLPDGALGLVVRGLHRAHIGAAVVTDTAALWVSVTDAPEAVADTATTVLATEYREVAEELLATMSGRAMTGLLDEALSAGALADTISWWPGLEMSQRIELLETLDVAARLQTAITWARAALAEATVTRKISSEVNEGFEKMQRDAILRRQMEAIRKELGEGGDNAIADYRERLSSLDASDKVREAILKEIDRYERVGEQSMEASWIRTWLDTVFEIPWSSRTDDELDLANARAVLDADHTGLDDVKERIVEFLAVRKLRAERGVDEAGHRRAGTILVLAGPPGVGKTSLGESVARALGRSFVRTSLGGIHDEAEIRGHRRTYVGARPGRIVRALIDAGTMNPVVLLDEIDKVGSDWRGDASAALLEVLDPAQNHTFRDHYLEIELDLSSVVFIATANTLDRMPAPLLDRMEVITISGYSDDEKLAIAQEHLLARVLDRNGVQSGEITIDPELVRLVIEDYTREAGVRRLEQRLDRSRRIALQAVVHEHKCKLPVASGALHQILQRRSSSRVWLLHSLVGPKLCNRIGIRPSTPQQSPRHNKIGCVGRFNSSLHIDFRHARPSIEHVGHVEPTQAVEVHRMQEFRIAHFHGVTPAPRQRCQEAREIFDKWPELVVVPAGQIPEFKDQHPHPRRVDLERFEQHSLK